MRVFQLAKELKLSSKELIKILSDLGIEAKSHMNELSSDSMIIDRRGAVELAEAERLLDDGKVDEAVARTREVYHAYLGFNTAQEARELFARVREAAHVRALAASEAGLPLDDLPGDDEPAPDKEPGDDDDEWDIVDDDEDDTDDKDDEDDKDKPPPKYEDDF